MMHPQIQSGEKKLSRWFRMTPEQRKADNDRKAKYRLQHRDRIVAKKRARYEANMERIKAEERERFYKKTYGISVADYDAALAKQSGVCAICGTDKPGRTWKNFAIDHCHVTGKIRGLLCVRCNSALGWYEKRREAVENYLSW